MERRNWTLKSLNELIYIDSFDSEEKADSLVKWIGKFTLDTSDHFIDVEISDFTPVLNNTQLKTFMELFYKNIQFLKSHKQEIKSQLDSLKKIRTYVT